MKWLLAAFLALTVGVTAALADPEPLLQLGKQSASGQKAHAVVVVPNIPSHRYKKLTLEVSAKPPQRVTASYVGSCFRANIGGLRAGDRKVGRTPLSMTLTLDTVDYSDFCNVTADATLSKKGRVTVQLVARR
jgi:hypothetical protein